MVKILRWIPTITPKNFHRNIFFLSVEFSIFALSKQTDMLKFSDGETFDTSGPLRKEKRYDGWYVIGQGMLIPVKDEAEADKVISSHKNG